MKKAILLTLIILLWNVLRYYHGGNDFRSSQSYWMRELLSSSYKIVVYLLPALLIFRAYRHQSWKVKRSRFRGRWALSLIIVMMWGKRIMHWYTGLNPNVTLLTFIYVLVVNSVVEEWVFRWVVFTALQKKLTPLQANMVQSILFWIVHLPFYSSMGRSWFSLLLWIGWVMCLWFRRWYVKKDTWSLFYPILYHSIWNGVLIFW